MLNILKIVILFTRKKNTKLSQFVSFYISSPMTSLIVAIMLKINPENEQKKQYTELGSLPIEKKKEKKSNKSTKKERENENKDRELDRSLA